MRELVGEYEEQLGGGESVVERVMWLFDRSAEPLGGRSQRVAAPVRLSPSEAIGDDRESENVHRSPQPSPGCSAEHLRQEGRLHLRSPRQQERPSSASRRMGRAWWIEYDSPPPGSTA